MARRRMLVRYSARPASGRIREARVIEGGEAPLPWREEAMADAS